MEDNDPRPSAPRPVPTRRPSPIGGPDEPVSFTNAVSVDRDTADTVDTADTDDPVTRMAGALDPALANVYLSARAFACRQYAQRLLWRQFEITAQQQVHTAEVFGFLSRLLGYPEAAPDWQDDSEW